MNERRSQPMNRREFMTVMGGAGALSMFYAHPTFASTRTTSLYVKGLVMVDFENPEFVRLGLPRAPGHRATLSIVPQTGPRMTLNVKGTGTVNVSTAIASVQPRIFVPELIRMREL